MLAGLESPLGEWLALDVEQVRSMPHTLTGIAGPYRIQASTAGEMCDDLGQRCRRVCHCIGKSRLVGIVDRNDDGPAGLVSLDDRRQQARDSAQRTVR